MREARKQSSSADQKAVPWHASSPPHILKEQEHSSSGESKPDGSKQSTIPGARPEKNMIEESKSSPRMVSRENILRVGEQASPKTLPPQLSNHYCVSSEPERAPPPLSPWNARMPRSTFDRSYQPYEYPRS